MNNQTANCFEIGDDLWIKYYLNTGQILIKPKVNKGLGLRRINVYMSEMRKFWICHFDQVRKDIYYVEYRSVQSDCDESGDFKTEDNSKILLPTNKENNDNDHDKTRPSYTRQF